MEMSPPGEWLAPDLEALREWLAPALESLRPPRKLSLSEWADQNFRLSAESAAEPGRWRTLPYQREILDAISDPNVTWITWKKSARIGYTKCIDVAIAYFMSQDPCPILIVQPTVEDAEGFSKEEIAPMLRDVPILTGLVNDGESKKRKSGDTILHKRFPGGVLSMVGANSGRGLRRISRRVVLFDEVDGYPESAGNDGDPIKLGEKRSEYYWNRKIIAGSTPLTAGSSRIEEMFISGDQRRYYVPCPHCDHFDHLVFSEEESKSGHYMKWPDDDPSLAHFVCRECGCSIDEEHKRSMIDRGQWRAKKKFRGHASFYLWAAYSLSPNASWGQIASEYIEVKDDLEKFKTFTNTALGKTWEEKGEAPDWEKLYDRREDYPIGTVPEGPIVLTAGVDVQQDRFVYEVVGWSQSKESWSIDAGIIWGDTAKPETWGKLDEFLGKSYQGHHREHQVAMLAIDSSYATQRVYNWARQHPMSRVIACKGKQGARSIVSAPSTIDVSVGGKTRRRGYKVWITGVDIAKGELYGFLRLKRGEDGSYPSGYCHFPEHGSNYFKELTAEQLMTSVNKKTNKASMSWHVIPNRENHYLDARVLARVASSVLGIDRMKKPKPRSGPIAPAMETQSIAQDPGGTPQPTPPKPRRDSGGFWNRTNRSSWIKRR